MNSWNAEWTYNANGFKCKEDRAKEKWKIFEFAECFFPFDTDRIMEHVIADNGEWQNRYNIGNRRKWRQILQISYLSKWIIINNLNELKSKSLFNIECS